MSKIQKILGNPFIIFILFFLIYYFSSPGKTQYDYFTRLSDAFLHGRIYLSQNPSWLNELIPAGLNKFYVPYPPMPAVLLMPFTLIFKNMEQQIFAHLIGAGTIILTIKLGLEITKNKKIAYWSGILIGLGSIVWFLSSVGSSWYLGQITAVFFLTAALVETFGKKRPILVGIFLGGAYLSRIQTILSLPIFLYMLKGENWFKNYTKLLIGVLPFILFNFIYNYLRFGVIWDKSYYLIPGVLTEPWFKKGIFDISYIPNNLSVMFFSLPKFLNKFPYIIPSWAGLSILITTPAFLFSLKAKIKEGINKISWLSIFLISLVFLSHGTTGFAQFGYRFAADIYPILTFLTIKGVSQMKLSKVHWVLLFIGIIVNFWGIVWINKLGWVSY